MEQKYKWLDLYQKNLTLAQKKGLPVRKLLDDKQSFKEFIHRRNKTAHGDLIGYRSFYEERYKQTRLMEDALEMIRITEKQALDQLSKSLNFIKRWAEQKPTIIFDDE